MNGTAERRPARLLGRGRWLAGKSTVALGLPGWQSRRR